MDEMRTADGVPFLRTPDAAFADLPGYPFAPNYLTFEGLRLHYVDEGPRDGPVVLLMHGMPTWSFLNRHIIARLAAAGYRCVAADHIGFGRSDKVTDDGWYSITRHVAAHRLLVKTLDLRGATLFCQDWGGLIGLRLVAAFPERFAGVVVANTGLPTGGGMTDGFKAWLNFSQSVPQMPIGMLINGGTMRDLSPEEVAAYDAPFPDESYKEGARQFPALVPVTPEHASVAQNLQAWTVLERFERPLVTAFSDGDPVSRSGEAVFQARVPGAKGQPHVTLKGGHFLQEDCPGDIVEVIDGLISRTRT